MNFDFSGDATELREVVRRVLDERAGPASARVLMNSEAPYDQALWQEVRDLGWTSACIPEAFGGLGMGPEEACVLAEEIGRSQAPIPFMSALIATYALLMAPGDERAGDLLKGIAAGQKSVCIGWGEDRPTTPDMPSAIFAGGRIRGVKTPLADLMIADAAIVTAQGPDGAQLYLLDMTAAGVARAPQPTVDLVRRFGRLVLDDAPAYPLGTPESFRAWLNQAAILTTFEALGTAEAALAMVTAYARERVAFGQAIGRFQAVKHKCADMYIALQIARAHGFHGIWAMQADAPELPQAAAAARVASLDALRLCAEENVELHGGIGFTWESDCQLYYRRNRAIAAALGSRSWWADRLVNALEQRNELAA